MMRKILITVLIAAFAAGANAQNAKTTAVNGVQCTIIPGGSQERIKQNDVITFQVVQKTDKDSVLFSTYQQGHPVKVQVHPSTNPGDLMDIFPLLAVNDSAKVSVPVDSVFKGHEAEMPPMFKKGGNIVFNLKIQRVQSLNDAMAERNQQIEQAKAADAAATANYIKVNNLNPVTTPTGLKYVVKLKGIKPKPLAGDTVLVNYTGRLLDGTVFDSSIPADAKAGGVYNADRPYEPLKFAVGTARVIPGWDEGLSLLNEGSKATFIVPSSLGYGEQGSGPIPPNATLIFDIELVKVIRVKHPAVTVGSKTPVKSRTAVKKRTTVKKTS